MKSDREAASLHYAGAKTPLWVDAAGLTGKGKALVSELGKAADWGLPADAFAAIAEPAASATPETLATAETQLTLAALKYVRFARGGRIDPRSLSRILDLDPPVKDPKVVLTELAAASDAAAYLTAQHPKHPQFVKLREAYLKARGPKAEAPADPSLKIKLPSGKQAKTLKAGMEHADVAVLRERLKQPAAQGAKDTLFDEPLAEALKAFQEKAGLEATGQLTGRTRSALNAEGDAKPDNSGRNVQRILMNMERWRWMPEDMGAFHVWNNVPEFNTRVVRGNEVVFKEKIIVGLPEWATPSFSAEMKNIIFGPSWGVPDGIKTRELLPRLKKAGGSGFFDQLFGGGGGGNVIRAYGFNVYRNGKQIDPDSVDWSSTDIRAYSFIQPPGGKNPLGIVKFTFPNKHDVYMHDTIERQLFAQSYRGLSHGCMRVQNPRRFAEVLLEEDKGWNPQRVGQAAAGGDIPLDKHIWVHTTYMTMIVDDSGALQSFGDIYGHDQRLSAAMTGRAIGYEREIETASADEPSGEAAAGERPAKKNQKNAKKDQAKPSNYRMPSDFSEAMSGLLTN